MNYISTFENVLSKDLVNELHAIAKTEPHERRTVGEGGFDEWNVANASRSLAEDIVALQTQLAFRYMEINQLSPKMFPEKHTFEQPRLKRYRGEDWFPPHADVADRITARRFLAFLFYVQAPKAGGETVWPSQKIKVEPREGACVVFPPLWPWLHYGSKSEGEKLILSGYFQYV